MNLITCVLALSFAVISLAFLLPGPIQREAYMGAEYCGSCHQEEYKAWSDSSHAKAFVHLPNDKKTDLACLSCHATGVLEKNQPVFSGVQCEACHGPGQYYALHHAKNNAGLSKLLFEQKAETTCIQCHAHDTKLSLNPHKFNHETSK
jgi:cytochrome c551/c552